MNQSVSLIFLFIPILLQAADGGQPASQTKKRKASNNICLLNLRQGLGSPGAKKSRKDHGALLCTDSPCDSSISISLISPGLEGTPIISANNSNVISASFFQERQIAEGQGQLRY